MSPLGKQIPTQWRKKPHYKAEMGKGYGKELLKTAISELSAQGFQEIFLWVLEENNRARHFYERCGFLKAADVIEEKIGGKNVREIRYVRKVNSEKF